MTINHVNEFPFLWFILFYHLPVMVSTWQHAFTVWYVRPITSYFRPANRYSKTSFAFCLCTYFIQWAPLAAFIYYSIAFRYSDIRRTVESNNPYIYIYICCFLFCYLLLRLTRLPTKSDLKDEYHDAMHKNATECSTHFGIECRYSILGYILHNQLRAKQWINKTRPNTFIF